jgi:hypothetical protein
MTNTEGGWDLGASDFLIGLNDIAEFVSPGSWPSWEKGHIMMMMTMTITLTRKPQFHSPLGIIGRRKEEG